MSRRVAARTASPARALEHQPRIQYDGAGADQEQVIVGMFGEEIDRLNRPRRPSRSLAPRSDHQSSTQGEAEVAAIETFGA